MKQFLRNIVITVFLLMVLNLIVFLPTNYLYNLSYLKAPNELGYAKYLLSDSHGHSLGKMTERYGIKNLSTPSDSYVDMYRKLTYISGKQDVAKIYLSCGDRLFTIYRDHSNNHERSSFLMKKSDYNNTLTFLKDQFIDRFFIYPTSKQHSFFTSVLLRKLRLNKPWREVEWSELNSSDRMREASKRVNQFSFNTISQNQLSHFHKILTFCREKKIECVLVKFPVTREFRECENYIDFDLCKTLSIDTLNILDYNSLYFHEDEYFKDQDHLNVLGAREFSKVLFTNE